MSADWPLDEGARLVLRGLLPHLAGGGVAGLRVVVRLPDGRAVPLARVGSRDEGRAVILALLRLLRAVTEDAEGGGGDGDSGGESGAPAPG